MELKKLNFVACLLLLDVLFSIIELNIIYGRNTSNIFESSYLLNDFSSNDYDTLDTQGESVKVDSVKNNYNKRSNNGNYKYYCIVKVSKLNIRDKPNIEADIIGNYKSGDTILIQDEFGDWLKISGYSSGFINSNYVDIPGKKSFKKDEEEFSFSSSFMAAFALSLFILFWLSLDRKKKDARFASGYKITKGLELGGPIVKLIICVFIGLAYAFIKWKKS